MDGFGLEKEGDKEGMKHGVIGKVIVRGDMYIRWDAARAMYCGRQKSE
jgi:hypothetical protein